MEGDGHSHFLRAEFLDEGVSSRICFRSTAAARRWGPRGCVGTNGRIRWPRASARRGGCRNDFADDPMPCRGASPLALRPEDDVFEGPPHNAVQVEVLLLLINC